MSIAGILDENNLKHKLIQFSSSIQKTKSRERSNDVQIGNTTSLKVAFKPWSNAFHKHLYYF